jgi:chromate transport protein ChrA
MSLGRYLLLVFFFNAFALGNGPVMLSLFQTNLVEREHLLTTDELLYAFTTAQVTPGQNNLYVASVGYLLYGMVPALLAVGVIVVPGYLMLPLMRGQQYIGNSVAVQRFIRGMTAASLGLMLAAAVGMGRQCLVHPVAWTAFLGTLVLTQLLRWNELLSLLLASGIAAGIWMYAS